MSTYTIKWLSLNSLLIIQTFTDLREEYYGIGYIAARGLSNKNKFNGKVGHHFNFWEKWLLFILTVKKFLRKSAAT